MDRIPRIEGELDGQQAESSHDQGSDRERGGAERRELEKLIRANQDFEVLHPEEFEDDYSIPLWLRVTWRKQHPDVQLPAKNPGAAYPEILSQVYRRMVANPNDAWGPDATPTRGDG